MNISEKLSIQISWEARADKVVPPSGYTARLTQFTAGAMAFLAVFALALSLATGRLADRWSSELARSATVRISAPVEQLDIQAAAALRVLRAAAVAVAETQFQAVTVETPVVQDLTETTAPSVEP